MSEQYIDSIMHGATIKVLKLQSFCRNDIFLCCLQLHVGETRTPFVEQLPYTSTHTHTNTHTHTHTHSELTFLYSTFVKEFTKERIQDKHLDTLDGRKDPYTASVISSEASP